MKKPQPRKRLLLKQSNRPLKGENKTRPSKSPVFPGALAASGVNAGSVPTPPVV